MQKVFSILTLFLLTVEIVSAQTTITGTLLGNGGKPMPVANVIITTPMDQAPIKIADADKDGKYGITVDSAGIWMLWFAGVNHSSHQVALYVDKPTILHLDVRLKTYDYFDTLNDVGVEGEFNEFNIQNPVPMQKQSDGTFVAKIETKGDTIGYKIVGITENGHTINGTQSETFVYDGEGNYWSILTPSQGKVKIVFDPAKLERSDEPVKVTFADSQSMEAKFAAIYGEVKENLDNFGKAQSDYMKSGKDLKQFKYDWSKETESIIGRLEKESNPILRQELYMEYLNLVLFHAKLDSSIAQKAIGEIPPSSIIWSLDPYMPTLLYFVGLSNEQRDNYIQRVLSENPVVDVKAKILHDMFMRAKEEAVHYYDILVNKYGDTYYGKIAKAEFSPEIKIAVGKPVPPFSVASLEDSTKVFTDDSFKGKYYLIDFWATWCAPCVAEMEYLHKAYARFKDKNFTILSVSLDGSSQDVVKSRKGKWQMPWLQAFGGHGWDSKMVKDFDVMAIPMPILVDTTGTIVANEGLSGDYLEKTLEKYLGK